MASLHGLEREQTQGEEIENLNSGDDEVETTEHNGVTVYVNDDEDDTTERFAVLEDGTFVLGREGATEDVIDLRNGDAAPISGDILSAWEATTDGYARFAVDVDPEDLQGDAEAAEPTVKSVKYTYGSVYADGDVRGVQFNMKTESEKDADDVKKFIDGQITLAKSETDDPQAKQFLEDTEVTTSGTTVAVRNEVTVDEITPVITQLVTAFLTGMTDERTVADDDTVNF